MSKASKKLRGILCVFLLTGMIAGCSTTGQNGSNEAVAKFNQGSITQNEVFNKMVKTSGMPAVLEMTDKAILDKISPVTEEMKTKAKSQADKVKATYGESFEDALKANGFMTEQDYLDAMIFNDQRNTYLYKYIEENILSDEEIQTYYDKYEPGIQASHILIKPKEDTDEGWKQALQTAKDLIVRLDKGEDFAKLAKENSEDPGSAVNGGDLGTFGKGAMVPEFETAAYALEKDKYTAEPVKSSFGYHIILKTAEEKKGALEEMRVDIVSKLSQEKLATDNTLANKALVKMRSDNGFTINNKVLKEQYEDFVKSLEAAGTEK